MTVSAIPYIYILQNFNGIELASGFVLALIALWPGWLPGAGALDVSTNVLKEVMGLFVRQ